MKTTYSILLLLLAITGYGQTVQSACTGPDSVVKKYRDDADKLNYRHIYKFNSPWQDSIPFDRQLSSRYRRALIAVYNAITLPARDTVVNIFNIHCYNPVVNHVGLLADSSLNWVKNLLNNAFPCGNSVVDYYTNKYSLKRGLYTTFPIKYPLIQLVADSNCNTKIIADSIRKLTGVLAADNDYMNGDGDDIMDSITPNYVWLVYKHGWGDCTAGCYYRRYWGFRVYNDCSVEYGGSYGASLTVGIKEEEIVFEGIKVYPNPVKDKLNIEFNSFESSAIKIELINSLGQVLVALNNARQKQEINLSDFAPGIYFLKLLSDQKSISYKIVRE